MNPAYLRFVFSENFKNKSCNKKRIVLVFLIKTRTEYSNGAEHSVGSRSIRAPVPRWSAAKVLC